MADSRKCFTMIWKIKNFCFTFSEPKILSPAFMVQTMGETKWRLKLDPKFYLSISCYLNRESNDNGPDQLNLDYELSFLSNDGLVLHSVKYLNEIYIKGTPGVNALSVKSDEVLLHKDQFIPDDTLCIRCKMWERQKQVSQTGKCFAETRIETECRNYVGIIKKFTNIEASSKSLVGIESSLVKTFISFMNLSVGTNGKLAIEIKPVDDLPKNAYRCKIFLRDTFGKTWKSGEGEFYNTDKQLIHLVHSKKYITENKKEYLSGDDVLTIELKIILPTGKTIERIDDPEYEWDCQCAQKMLSKMMKTDLYSEAQAENLTVLKDDMFSLFREGILCDTSLKTATETFPAHMAVLSARSTVFKSMFTADMKEKTNKCVVIDDLDSDTVRRMLVFIYSATIDNLQYETAKSLYFAADKYNISSLKQRCSNLLKQNLTASNCCDALLLADKHQDMDLKNAVKNYIVRNDEAVLSSNEWKKLENDHSQLTTEVFRFLYMKFQRN